MDEISMDIERLLDAVHRSSEYQEYQKQAAQLDKDPELKARVMRFRGDNFRLQSQVNQDELFHAAKGEGAYLNGNAIHASSTEHFGDAVISYGSTPYTKSEAKNLFPIFYNIFMKCGDFRRTGSAELDMCYVACGREHGYLERDLKPWDYSAGTVILREAGGVVKNWKGEEPSYLKNEDILACVPQFEENLLKELL